MNHKTEEIMLKELSVIWLKTADPENSSEFSMVLDQILNREPVIESEETPRMEEENKPAAAVVNLEAIIRDLAAHVNLVQADPKSGRKRWGAAMIKNDIIIQSELLWNALSCRLDDRAKHQAHADKLIRYQLQSDVLRRMDDQGYLKKDVLKPGKVGAKLKITLQNGSSFVITGFVLNKEAFSNDQISEFETRADDPVLKNLANWQLDERTRGE